MKKNFLLSLSLFLISMSGFSTTWIINNSSNTFTPATITISLGDTVSFVISFAHDAREVSQITWNANGNTPLTGGFQTPFGGGLVLPAQLGVGVHYYVCTPHASMGMKAIIIVQNCTAPSMPGTISGNSTVCSGISTSYSFTPITGATFYTWTLPGGWSGSSTTNSIAATANAISGNISVTANNSCGASAPQTKAISVNTAPSLPGAINGNTIACQGSSNSYSISTINGATFYSWVLPGGWSGTSSTNSISTVANAISGNISVTANNSCGASTPQTLAVTVNSSVPAMPGSINGNTTVCNSSFNIYSITAVSFASSYTWILPVNWSGTSTTNSISTVAISNSGIINVTANNSCGSSPTRTLAVAVSGGTALPQPGTIIGNATVCPGSSNLYSVAAVSFATFYIWTLPGGWSGNSSTNSITASASASSGNISVSANNSCGASAPQTIGISVNTIDASVSISGTTLTANASGGTYQWINCINNLPILGQTNQNFLATANGSYAVIVTKNGCSDTSSCYNIVSVGIAKIALLDDLMLYPNPSNDIITIKTNNNGLGLTFNITDQTGRHVMAGKLNNETTSFDISQLEAGIYFFQVVQSRRVYKVIKK